MTLRERERLIDRIRQLRRARASELEPPSAPPADLAADETRTIEARLAHLERMVEGLQDSVHRESQRHSRLIAELQAQVRPSAIGAALDEDARNRGL